MTNFYAKVKKQYQYSDKPFRYEFSLFSEQPRPKKFRLIIKKFIEIFRDNMLDEYSYENNQTNNYWMELEKNFSHTNQMSFIMCKINQKNKDIKILIYFALLFHTKKLFEFFESLFDKMGYLYRSIDEKRAKYQIDIEILSCFKDGQYIIQSQLINDFNHFREEIEKKEIMIKNDVIQEIIEEKNQVKQEQVLIKKEEKPIISSIKPLEVNHSCLQKCFHCFRYLLSIFWKNKKNLSLMPMNLYL